MNSENDSKSKIPIYKNLKDFEKNLPKTIKVLETSDGDKVYIVGCAHFSLKSQNDVSFVIRNVIPKAIVLELCPLRLHTLKLDENALLKESSQLTTKKIKEIFKEHGITGGLFYLSFLRISANITHQLGIAPGGECRRAIIEAKKLKNNCKILLGDRPINITLKRAMFGLNMKKRLQFSYLLNSTNNIKITQEDIEKFKIHKSNSLQIMKNELPTIYKSFIKERDYILAHSLLLATKIFKKYNPNNKQIRIVGIVGMGHMSGIIKYFGHTKKEIVEELMKIPKNNWFNRNNNDNRNGVANLIMTILKNLKFTK